MIRTPADTPGTTTTRSRHEPAPTTELGRYTTSAAGIRRCGNVSLRAPARPRSRRLRLRLRLRLRRSGSTGVRQRVHGRPGIPGGEGAGHRHARRAGGIGHRRARTRGAPHRSVGSRNPLPTAGAEDRRRPPVGMAAADDRGRRRAASGGVGTARSAARTTGTATRDVRAASADAARHPRCAAPSDTEHGTPNGQGAGPAPRVGGGICRRQRPGSVRAWDPTPLGGGAGGRRRTGVPAARGGAGDGFGRAPGTGSACPRYRSPASSSAGEGGRPTSRGAGRRSGAGGVCGAGGAGPPAPAPVGGRGRRPAHPAGQTAAHTCVPGKADGRIGTGG